MGLEVVLEEIVAEGQKEESRLLSEAEAEAKQILAKAQEQAQATKDRIAKEAKGRAQALERELLGASEFETRRNLLSVERELVGDLRLRVLRALADLPQERRRKILDGLVRRAKKELPTGTVHSRKEDLDYLAKQGYKPGRALPTAGGLLVEAEDGNVLIDLRFEVLLDDAWKHILMKTRDLFEVA